jgi:hypothetical protein
MKGLGKKRLPKFGGLHIVLLPFKPKAKRKDHLL